MAAKIDKLVRPFQRYMGQDTASGTILLISALTALIIANTPWATGYHELWETHFSFRFGDFSVNKTLHEWINDGLMAMFFFTVGLEIKREIMGGELSSWKLAALPLAAALGGMIVPAIIYTAFTAGTDSVHGWGIPMATDIAFALGILALLGKRVPVSLRVFLTALAIADDLGAVLVIAFFYTSKVSVASLLWGLGFIGVLLLGNYLGIRRTLFYAVIGIGGVWLAFLMSGIHATIAGVLAAMTIPARRYIDENKFVESLNEAVDRFKAIPPNDKQLLESEQYEAVHEIGKLSLQAAPPLQRLEHVLVPWVTFLVMPIFAFANSGVTIETEVLTDHFFGGVSIGIIAGLVVGKFTGIFGATWFAQRTGIASLPEGLQLRHIAGVALLGGIGFTMSLFITNLAFTDDDLIMKAKLGIFAASLLAGSAGFFLLRKVTAGGDFDESNVQITEHGNYSNTLGTRKN